MCFFFFHPSQTVGATGTGLCTLVHEQTEITSRKLQQIIAFLYLGWFFILISLLISIFYLLLTCSFSLPNCYWIFLCQKENRTVFSFIASHFNPPSLRFACREINFQFSWFFYFLFYVFFFFDSGHNNNKSFYRQYVFWVWSSCSAVGHCWEWRRAADAGDDVPPHCFPINVSTTHSRTITPSQSCTNQDGSMLLFWLPAWDLDDKC